MGRHSFIRQFKLRDVRGRVDYISNPKRQEHLYAAYSTVEPEFWKYLVEQNQYDFKRSRTRGECIEARELVIALPESLQEYVVFQRHESYCLLLLFLKNSEALVFPYFYFEPVKACPRILCFM